MTVTKFIRLTNRFHVARTSQMTTKCGWNKKVVYDAIVRPYHMELISVCNKETKRKNGSYVMYEYVL